MNSEEFKKKMKEIMKENREAFEGEFKKELNDLMGLSRAEIDLITPDTTDLEIYDQLITVVKAASRVNLTQAELKDRIKDLGDIAVKIAKKIPKLANIF